MGLTHRGRLFIFSLISFIQGTTRPEDGLTKLKQMESSTGIWTMRCTLIIERNHIIIVDKGNGVGISQPISRRQILDSSKLKEFAGDSFKFVENGRKLSKWVENTVGKGEIAH